MEKDTSLNNYIKTLQGEIKTSSIFNIDLTSKKYLRIMEDDFLHLFDVLKKDLPLVFVSLPNGDNTSINNYRKSDKYALNNVFTSLNDKEQNQLLNDFLNKYNNEIQNKSSTNFYLSFGYLKYSLNPFQKEVNNAPLMFIPVEKFYIKDDSYFLKLNVNDVLLNEALIEKLKKERSLDLSYPLDSSFNIASYLYYVNAKVKPLNWNINNYFILGFYPVNKYYDYKVIVKNKDKILEQKLIKKLTYLNSEFFNFSSHDDNILDSKFLSLLELSNEEFSVLKKVASKEDLFIQTNSEESSLHIASNIILSYLLNNQKLLVVYSSQDYKNKLLNIIKNNSFDDFVLSLDSSLDSKKSLISDVTNIDKYLNYSTYKQNEIINEDIKNYYQSKNNFKSLLNILRTKKNNLGISINRIIELYYELKNYPLITASINDAYRLTKDNINYYLNMIDEFNKSISSLQCPINKHPFYGLDKKKLLKNDYLVLKNSSTQLTTYLNDAIIMLINSNIKYDYPNVSTLKEYKTLLNILSFLDDYQYDVSYLKMDNLDDIYDSLISIKAQDYKLKLFIDDLVDKYTRKIHFISTDIINEYNTLDNKKSINKKIKKLLGDSSLNNQEISYIIASMDNYYKTLNNNHEAKEKIPPSLLTYLNEDKLDVLRNIINDINTFKLTLKKFDIKFSIDNYYKDNSKDKKMLRRTLQTLFNRILENEKIVQTYFSKEIYDFENIELSNFYSKMQEISSKFISINEYTSYYSLLNTLNNTYDHLGDELIKYDIKDFKNIFLKRFYYDFIFTSLKRNEEFNSYSKDALLLELEKFYSSDTKRKELISNILKDYLYLYVRKNNQTLKQEGMSLKNSIVKSQAIPPLSSLTTSLVNEISSLKPCIFVPYSKVSQLLKEDKYAYDGILYLINEEMEINDILPSIYKGKTSIFISCRYLLKDDINTYLMNDLSKDNLLKNVSSSLDNIYYKQEERISPLKGNFFDKNTKVYLKELLIDKGFNVQIDYHFLSYNVDLLVSMPDKENKIGIILDHLSYSSPEEASDNFVKEIDILSKNNIIPYRIFTSAYFLNEELENKDLISFIISNSDTPIKKNKIVKKQLLMDYLFPLYVEPNEIYYSINKKNLSKKELLLKLVTESAPISINDLDIVMGTNTNSLLSSYIKSNILEQEDNFIYVPNKKITFRRVDRSKNIIRNIDNVSNKEIYDAIYQIVNNQGSISIDKLVKMILLSLGYKKTNPSINKKILDDILYLKSKSIIFENDGILYKDLNNEKE
jgi:hypothetical protein